MKPTPRLTPDNEPFYKALGEGRFMLPYCKDCAKPHLPAGPVCPFCFSDRIEWKPASGRGWVSTFTVVHKAWFPDFADEVPYNVVQVELEEGPRLTANVVGVKNEALKVGLAVEIVRGESMPRFRVAR